MTTTGFNADPAPTWSWPEDNTSSNTFGDGPRQRMPGTFSDEQEEAHDQAPQTEPSPPTNASANTGEPQPPRPSKAYLPRTCRICFEVVQPTYHMPTASLPNPFQNTPRVTYESEDPASGRLLRPCKCKGSSRYVHEGCLQTWRYADPDFGSRNYWVCPTCGFSYRLQRMNWGRAINNTATQIVLTLVIFLLAMFALGFVADPIINLYVDPYDTLTSGTAFTRLEALAPDEEGERTWTEHFVKGAASLGLLGFVKVIFALSPWQWWNLRNSGIMNTNLGRQNTGRDRLANVSWIVVAMGIGTFLWATYKVVRAWSRRVLEKASEKVMDVPLDDDEDEGEDIDAAADPAAT